MKPYGRNKYHWTTYPRKTHNRLANLGIWDDWSDIYTSKKAARRCGKKEIQDQLDSMEKEE